MTIARSYYEESGYFEEDAAHLLDPASRFQRYRAREVLGLCGPVEGARVVDLGCGWGTISFPLARDAGGVVGVDFARAALRLCVRRAASLAEPGGGVPAFVQADARRTPLADGSWDIVVAADLIEHLYPEDTRAVYAEAYRLLRPGGRFVIWTPSPSHVLERLRARRVLTPDPTHVDYKTLGRVVRELGDAGFEIVSAGHRPSHLPGIRLLERVGQRWIPWLRRRVAVVAVRPHRSNLT